MNLSEPAWIRTACLPHERRPVCHTWWWFDVNQ